jgi:hypothetical protein
MIDGNRWILAVIALASSLLLGEIAGRLVRGSMSREDRSNEIREMARPVSSFLFWACTALGVFVAVASTSRHAFEEIPDRMLARLPDLLLAGLILIAGYAVAIGVGAAAAQSSIRASGKRHRGLERALRYAVLGTTVALALSQLGVDTTVLSLALAIIVGAPAVAITLLTAFGGRHVAREIAAGRALRSHLKVGFHLACGDVDGTIVAVHQVSVEVETIDGRRIQMPMHCLMDSPYSVSPARSRA